jgi:hypothetical protein
LLFSGSVTPGFLDGNRKRLAHVGFAVSAGFPVSFCPRPLAWGRFLASVCFVPVGGISLWFLWMFFVVVIILTEF